MMRVWSFFMESTNVKLSPIARYEATHNAPPAPIRREPMIAVTLGWGRMIGRAKLDGWEGESVTADRMAKSSMTVIAWSNIYTSS